MGRVHTSMAALISCSPLTRDVEPSVCAIANGAIGVNSAYLTLKPIMVRRLVILESWQGLTKAYHDRLSRPQLPHWGSGLHVCPSCAHARAIPPTDHTLRESRDRPTFTTLNPSRERPRPPASISISQNRPPRAGEGEGRGVTLTHQRHCHSWGERGSVGGGRRLAGQVGGGPRGILGHQRKLGNNG